MNMNKKMCAAAITMLALTAPVRAAAADGIEINHLGVNNTLVRITGDANYLLLPVQESFDDARINVLVDGKVAETIYVRLAKSKTDYTVPFDLSRFKGKNVILDVVSPQDRNSVREAKDDVCWKGMVLSDTFDTTDRETKYRPAFHHTPLYGWMNDPNGMFYKDGKWHLYYQYNPYGSKWQNMTWGHSQSDNLVDWEHLPIAIRPDGLGSIFSGSCVVDSANTAGMGENAVIALFTSAGTSQMQSFASSSDNGTTFDVYGGNPVITLDSEARDPNMFWNDATGEWNLVLAHALDREMLFFSSPDLKNWTLKSAFGKGVGAQEGVWECPDLFKLPVDGSDESKWVQLCNLNPGGIFGGSATQYFIGDWDGTTFTADTEPDGTVLTRWLDYGKDHYATVSWSDAPDARRTLIGWMSNWQYAAEVPTKQFRSANTLPREAFIFTGADGRRYVGSAPSPELLGMRGKAAVSVSKASAGNSGREYTLPVANGGICEIEATINALKAEEVTLTLANKAGDKVVMTYDPRKHTMTFDRTASGLVDFSEEFPAVTESPTFENSGEVSLRIFVDRSSIELFGDNGRFVMTNLVFPTEPYTTLTIASKGGSARVGALRIYPLNPSK